MNEDIHNKVIVLSPDSAEQVLALLRQLEVSLAASQTCLLARDLEGVERGVREQSVLQQQLLPFFTASASLSFPSAVPGQQERRRAVLADQLLEVQQRIRHAVRVQAALVTRAQTSLRILANYLLGQAVVYAPARVGIHQEANSCRV